MLWKNYEGLTQELFFLFALNTHSVMEEYLGGINMLTVIKIKFQLAKLKYYTRKETKAFHEGKYDKAVKYGKIVGSEFDKLFG